MQTCERYQSSHLTRKYKANDTVKRSSVDQDHADDCVQTCLYIIQMFNSRLCVLFHLDVGTGSYFVNTNSFQTMWFAQNWKSRLCTCTLCETHFTVSVTVTVCQLPLSYDDTYRYISPQTTHTCTHTRMHLQSHKHSCWPEKMSPHSKMQSRKGSG